MSTNWPISELGKEAINASRPFSFKIHPEVVFVNTGDVLAGKFLHADISSGKGLPGQAKKALVRNDILLTEIRPGNGRFAFVDFPPEKYVVSTKFMVIESLGRVLPRFLYHVLTNQAALNEFQRIAESRSGTFPQITFDSIAHFPVPTPPIAEQYRLVQFLDAMETRLDLLRETNATLEAIAQALFKSWFVDFDPVHAKARGEPPQGMDDATAAQFPDSFEESELGMIPKGWRAGELGEMLALRNERTKPSDETKSLPYVPIENIGAKTPFLAEFKSGEDANSSLILFKEGDILFGAMRPYFHKVCIAPFKGVTRTTVFTLSARNPKASAFALLLTYQDSTVDYATQHSEGSTIPYAKWKNSLERMPVLIPPDSVQEGFSEIVKSFIDRANANVQQAQTLTQLRDTLLPKLISGQLQLPEAEALLAEELP